MSRVLFFLITSLFITPVYSLDLPSSQIADDSTLRVALKDTLFTESPAKLSAQPSRIEYLQNGERVEVRIQENRNEVMVLISRELMSGRIAVDKNPAVPRMGTGQFPGWAQGSWMLTRSKRDGSGTLIRIFPRSDQYTFIQFRSFTADKCLMDVILYGGFVVRSLPIPVPFDRLYTMKLNDILKLAGDKFPRRYFDPEPEYYRDSRKFISLVRARLGELRFSDDGAIDENGSYVFIKTLQNQSSVSQGLNCSGFSKWLIDGILRPVTGKRLSIAPLKAPFGERGSSFTENWEERRDPFFGLDWIRNLASEANRTLRSDKYSGLEEFEVRNENFSSMMVIENRAFVTNSYPGFTGEAGYSIEGLYPLLYTLTIDEPFQFYLAAVNTELGASITPENPRGAPRLRQYYHIAALVPYFDEYGIFRIVVFESASENSFNTFRSHYPEHYVNLVKIPISSGFDP
jgi:hypothetical protein